MFGGYSERDQLKNSFGMSISKREVRSFTNYAESSFFIYVPAQNPLTKWGVGQAQREGKKECELCGNERECQSCVEGMILEKSQA